MTLHLMLKLCQLLGVLLQGRAGLGLHAVPLLSLVSLGAARADSGLPSVSGLSLGSLAFLNSLEEK